MIIKKKQTAVYYNKQSKEKRGEKKKYKNQTFRCERTPSSVGDKMGVRTKLP